ncbi:RNA methyltransferase [Primorskyibacter sp. S187A]|uniref:RNA methyltransferase n=1 Tax=Primorskyibacter sp. S187A TaxID=3415130 RepID=UPI003C7E77A5
MTDALTYSGEPAFVLVRPQMGENIGAAARAMLNFGLQRMHVVSPRDGWPSERAVAMASGAGRVLDDAQLHSSVADAVGDCSFVFATTARQRGLTKPVFSPEEAMREAARRIGRGEKVGVLFGPERAGLENEDIAVANAIVTVPVNPAFPSLNLAQCVLLTGYEWRRASEAVAGEIVPQTTEMGGADWAETIEVEKLAEHYEDRLAQAGFFFPETKAAHMKINLRNLWSRMPLTRADVQMLHGVMRQMVRWKERGE